MASSWEESYIGGLRTLAGDDRVLISIGAHSLVRDPQGRIALIQRSDDRTWALPGGTIELGETLRDCAVREVREECGLIAHSVTPFGLYTRAKDWSPNVFGHRYQHIALLCRVDSYEGEILRETDESVDAGWFSPDALPEGTGGLVLRALEDLAAFERNGVFALD
ncbi:NUDIX domain-containing protein [Actinoplanes friuliensis]|uniref:Putative NUDIX hydrolase n=1 Tax=Actinoplanes friuliensis DSM 7358 TaxID=1246995 RepID=U5VU30_9ACTN|nr:NUDIX domain-containing protein [Actinoplanes friuliensis]AGZ40503.1 putative NUDIX hydrolase [Actinoplanes friuliensis DSM 7358]